MALSLIQGIVQLTTAILNRIASYLGFGDTVSVDGKRILVTGACGGIGKKLVEILGKNGAVLALVDINEEANTRLAEELERDGIVAVSFTADLTDSNQIRNLVYRVMEHPAFGTIDILVNNAGVLAGKYFMDQTEDEIKNAINVNYFAPVLLTRAVLPDMLARSSGHIVTVCSVASLLGAPTHTEYCGSKFAIHGFMEALDMEFGIRSITGIKFTTVYPYTLNAGLAKCFDVQPARFNPLLESAEVAVSIYKGITKQTRYVYVPSAMALTAWFAPALTKRIRSFFGTSFEAVYIPKS